MRSMPCVRFPLTKSGKSAIKSTKTRKRLSKQIAQMSTLEAGAVTNTEDTGTTQEGSAETSSETSNSTESGSTTENSVSSETGSSQSNLTGNEDGESNNN